MTDKKLEGRRAALSVLQKTKPPEIPPPPEPVDLSGLTEAVQALAENRPDFGPLESAIQGIKLQSEAADLAPIIAAIRAIKLQSEAADLAPVVEAIKAQKLEIDLTELKAIRTALNENTAAILSLVRVAQTPKTVVYDSAGRVIEIKLKKSGG